MRRTISLALLLAVGAASPAAANFLGSVVQLDVSAPTTATPIAVATTATVVDPGVEFPNLGPLALPGQLVVQTAIDLNATSITIDFDNVTYVAYATATFNGYILTDVNGTLPPFAAATIDTSVTTLGLTPQRVTVTENQIFINVSGLSFTPATFAKIDVTFGTAPQPTAPSNLQATVAGNLLTLSWVPPTTQPSGYLIEAGTGPGLSNIASVPVGPNPPGITAPVPNGTYFIRVRAIYPGGPGAPSNEVSVTVGCGGPPAAPLAFAVTQGPGGNPVQFSWAPPAQPVGGFVLEAGTATGLANIATVPLAGTATSFVVPGVPPGTYFVRLRARNACGVSAPSQEVVLTVGASCAAPAAPTLTASVNGSLASFAWGSGAGTPPISYTLFAGSSPGAANLATVPFGQATSFQIALPPGTYYVRVVASNACGTSAPSNEATLVVGTPAGAPNLTFTVTPNPVPFSGLPGCIGAPAGATTWYYTLRIINQGTAPFVIGSFTGVATAPGSAPVVAQYPASAFVQAFGASTIAPQAFRDGPLCVWGAWEDATLQWTFIDVGGAAFTTPVISFLQP